jgi:hypothetical protein
VILIWSILNKIDIGEVGGVMGLMGIECERVSV